MFAALRHFYREIWRVRWALLISIGVLVARGEGWLPPEHPLSVIFTKASNATIGFILAHVLRQQAFPYVDLKTLLRERDPAFGYAFIAASIFYGSIIYAVALSL
ncbi:MAG TPA: hypothetical protein VLB12_02095 [Gemmatimonadales bacterium]|nr:hypothetical protein [Gemmatimonadales bacterium]